MGTNYHTATPAQKRWFNEMRLRCKCKWVTLDEEMGETAIHKFNPDCPEHPEMSYKKQSV